jgi:hypothetical protein
MTKRTMNMMSPSTEYATFAIQPVLYTHQHRTLDAHEILISHDQSVAAQVCNIHPVGASERRALC